MPVPSLGRIVGLWFGFGAFGGALGLYVGALEQLSIKGASGPRFLIYLADIPEGH
jgi:hypothetical protein